MCRHFVCVAALAMCLVGCAAMESPEKSALPTEPPEPFAHRVATSEVVLLWNCLQPEPGLVRVVGEALNPWQAQPIGFLEVQLVGVDAQDRQMAQATGRARDIQILTNQRSPFQLDLWTTGTEVRFDLYYRYQFHDEWDTSARLAGPARIGPQRLAQTQTQLARDICSPTQHLAR
jgi:hypothetical protein